MTERFAADLARALATRVRRTLARPDKRQAAVLVPLLAVDGEPTLLYTRRSSLLPHHQGQVAFPGGTHLPGEDGDLTATALREAHEEIGLDPADVRVLGTLDDIETLGSGFVITPVVGLAPHPYPWRPCPAEVDAIFTVAVSRLRAPGAAVQQTWDFDGHPFPIESFPVDGHVIWGATRRITLDLIAVLETLA